MNAWDVFTYAMLALLIGVLLWFVIGRWIDERRHKREVAEYDKRHPEVAEAASRVEAQLASVNEAMRRYREHR